MVMAMSKVHSELEIPAQYNRSSFSRIFRALDAQLNSVSEGQIVGTYNAMTSAPTAGVYQVGDFVRNSTPSELGAPGSKYVIFGWICTTSPLTFKQCRFLTGN